MKKRVLTHFEEQIIRLVHHDFGGMSIEDAAIKIEVTQTVIRRTLNRLRHKVPQLFPILTPQHRAILLMYDKHMSRKSIVAALSMTEKQLGREVTFLRKHGFLWNRKPDQYSLLMDGWVKRKF